MLKAEEECQLATAVIEDNDPEAREQLVKSNLRLVVNIAKKFTGRGMGLSDLIEEGNLGLIRAVDYFDPEQGARFSTYAAWWIKQGIKRSLLMNSQPVHVPTYMVTLINHWRRVAVELEASLGRGPSVDEMAEVMGLEKAKASSISAIVSAVSSSSYSFTVEDGEDNQSMEDTLPDCNAAVPGETMLNDEEKQKVIRLLKELKPREAMILQQHFGLCGNKVLTMKEIAGKLGLSRERIRQIQREALNKLYEYMSYE